MSTCCGRFGRIKEVGYDGMLMPDHVPKIEGDAVAAKPSRCVRLYSGGDSEWRT